MRTLARPGQLTRRSVRALLNQWPLALADDIEGIHQVRVASRRLRELVPVLAAGPTDHPSAGLRRDLRSVTRLFGLSRELDVGRQTLTAFGTRAPSHRTAIAIVRSRLALERVDAAREMRRAAAGVDVEGLAARTRGLAARLSSPGAMKACARRAAARLDRRARELEAALLDAGFVFAAGPLHRVRVALKKFRYALEVAERLGRFRLTRSMERLKHMQDLLGELHDLQILAGHVRDAASRAKAAGRPAIEALVDDIDGAIRGLHGRFVTDRESLAAVFARSTSVRHTLVTLPARDEPPARVARGRARRRHRKE